MTTGGESAGDIATQEPVVNVMRFDAGVGDFTLGVQEESAQLLRGIGTICLQLDLEVKAPPSGEAGRFLALQADLYGIHGSYQ